MSLRISGSWPCEEDRSGYSETWLDYLIRMSSGRPPVGTSDKKLGEKVDLFAWVSGAEPSKADQTGVADEASE